MRPEEALSGQEESLRSEELDVCAYSEPRFKYVAGSRMKVEAHTR